MRAEKYKNYYEQHDIFEFKNTSENIGKDELGDKSFHLRLVRFFHHTYLWNASKLT